MIRKRGVQTISQRLLGWNPRHIDLHSHLPLIFEHSHIASCLSEVFQRQDDPLSHMLETKPRFSQRRGEVKRSEHTLMVSILYCRIFFSFMSKTKLVPPSLALFGGRVSRKLLMMEHVVWCGVRRKRWILVVAVAMLRGTAKAYKSLDLSSEARLYWFRRGECQIGWMFPCEPTVLTSVPLCTATTKATSHWGLIEVRHTAVK